MATNASVVDLLLNQQRSASTALIGGSATFYTAGTNNLKTIYLDSAKQTQAANPYTLSATAKAQLYGDGNYKIVLKDKDGVTVETFDNLYLGVDPAALDMTALKEEFIAVVQVPPGVNVIPNPRFALWQGDLTVTRTAAEEVFSANGWSYNADGGAGGSITISRESFLAGQTVVPGEPTYHVRLLRTGALTGATYDHYRVRVPDVRTLAGQLAVVSFYARAAAAQYVSVVVRQHFGVGGASDVISTSDPFSISAVNYTRHSAPFSVPSISNMAIGDGSYLEIAFLLPLNVTYDIRIADVKMEPGTSATALNIESDEEIRLIAGGVTGFYSDSGTANEIVISTGRPWYPLFAGRHYRIGIVADNTGATTIDVDSIGAIPLLLSPGVPLAGGELAAGSIIDVIYDGSDFLIANGSIYGERYTPTTNYATLQNGSFEQYTDGVPDTWTAVALTNGTMVIDTTTPLHGAAGIEFIRTLGAGNGGGYLTSDFIECGANMGRSIRLFLASSILGLSNHVDVFFYDAAWQALSGGSASTRLLTTTSTPTSAYEYRLPFVCPSGARFFKVRVTGGDTDANVAGSTFFDGVSVCTDESPRIFSAGSISAWELTSGGSTSSSSIILPGSVSGETMTSSVSVVVAVTGSLSFQSGALSCLVDGSSAGAQVTLTGPGTYIVPISYVDNGSPRTLTVHGHYEGMGTGHANASAVLQTLVLSGS